MRRLTPAAATVIKLRWRADVLDPLSLISQITEDSAMTLGAFLGLQTWNWIVIIVLLVIVIVLWVVKKKQQE
jgi:disulfide bond formation protein DsbB